MQTEEKERKSMSRDEELDLYRGWVMLYIVGFIHVVSLTMVDWYSDTLASLLLIEMPIIFYISGAAYSLSSKKRYGEYILGRVKRVVVPLSIYLIVYVGYHCVEGTYQWRESAALFIRYWGYILSGEQCEMSHLWFIQPYLIIALMLPMLYKVSQRVTLRTIYPILVVIMAILYFYPHYVLCYLVPTFAGLYYRRESPYNRYIILLIMLCCMSVCLTQGYGWNMQINKFPSNAMFLAYTTSMLIVLHRPLKWCCKQACKLRVINWTVGQFARHDFTIYLYHIHVMAAVYGVYRWAGTRPPFETLHPITSYLFTSLGTLLSMIAITIIIDYAKGKGKV